MSAREATAEIFVTAFKALKPKQREAVLQKLVADVELAEDLADTLARSAEASASYAVARCAEGPADSRVTLASRSCARRQDVCRLC